MQVIAEDCLLSVPGEPARLMRPQSVRPVCRPASLDSVWPCRARTIS
jgi:hypothetical protein